MSKADAILDRKALATASARQLFKMYWKGNGEPLESQRISHEPF